MRFLLLVIACCAGAVAGVRAETPPDALELLAGAQTTATNQHKAIFVHFGASWCVWCRELDRYLDDATVRPLLERYFVVVHIDVQEHGAKKALENPNGFTVLKNLGGEDAGLPFYGVLDAAGKSIATSKPPGVSQPNPNIGFPATPDEIAAFLQLLRKGAPSISEADMQKIAAPLRAQAGT